MTFPARRFRSLQSVRLLGIEALVADSCISRLLGLAFLDQGQGTPALLFRRCRSVHTFGMRFPLDICLFDGAGQVLAWHRGVGPGRLVGAVGARCVLEVPSPPFRPEGKGGRETAPSG